MRDAITIGKHASARHKSVQLKRSALLLVRVIQIANWEWCQTNSEAIQDRTLPRDREAGHAIANHASEQKGGLR